MFSKYPTLPYVITQGNKLGAKIVTLEEEVFPENAWRKPENRKPPGTSPGGVWCEEWTETFVSATIYSNQLSTFITLGL